MLIVTDIQMNDLRNKKSKDFIENLKLHVLNIFPFLVKSVADEDLDGILSSLVEEAASLGIVRAINICRFVDARLILRDAYPSGELPDWYDQCVAPADEDVIIAGFYMAIVRNLGDGGAPHGVRTNWT